MSTSLNQIHWVAGLLEGEGFFGLTKNSPTIALKMNDVDVVEKFKSVVKTTDKIFREERLGGNPAYVTKLYGGPAIQWMMTIYPLMGLRRKAKIREILQYWKSRPSRKQLLGNARMIKLIMLSRGVSEEEAEVILLETMAR